MTTMTAERDLVTVGVDTHGDVHAVAVLDRLGRVRGRTVVASTPAGHAAALRWVAGHGDVDAVGVEGTGSYGAQLARDLHAAGHRVVEVDRPDRADRRRRGKDDPLDAEAAARAVLAGTATGVPKTRDGLVESIRALRVVRRGVVRDRTAAVNQLRALVLTAPPEVREQLRGLTAVALARAAARLRSGADLADPLAATKFALREVARRHEFLTAQLRDLDTVLAPLVTAAAPALVALFAVGVDTAGALLVTAVDNPDRLRSEAAFAHLCGVAPLPASSGKTRRHRLNRGGDRRANNALWRIALVRMSHDQRTRDYVARRTAEGLTKPEIMRCLKRYIAREIYTALRPPALDGL
jgi:transposase